MTQQATILSLTRLASGAVAAKRFVGFTGAQIAAAGAKAMGVSDYAAANGEAFPVNVIGSAKVEAGAAFGEGVAIKADAQGRAIAQAGAGEILGWSLQAAGAAGVQAEILLAL